MQNLLGVHLLCTVTPEKKRFLSMCEADRQKPVKKWTPSAIRTDGGWDEYCTQDCQSSKDFIAIESVVVDFSTSTLFGMYF